MKVIDLQKIRNTLPINGKVEVKRTDNSAVYLECKIHNPTLSERFPMTYEEDFAMILDFQRQIIGKEYISEFYTETTGSWWYIYLKRISIEFINVSSLIIEFPHSENIILEKAK